MPLLFRYLTIATTGLLITSCGSSLKSEHQSSVNADWASHGKTPKEQRYSPLKNINKVNISQLGLEWFYEFDTRRGQEATPLVIDGVMYTTTAWSKVYAFNGATGELLWSHDPEVPGKAAAKGCCDVVNRGVAFADGKVFSATFDGRLIALDAKTGDLLWSVLTVDQTQPYTISGAPRVAKGKVFIGNGGADLGVRGYVSAYDAVTGKLIWRFYTVPGDPNLGPDGAASDEALEKIAASTWSGREYLKHGGGGTVWDSIVYDEEFDQLYIGVGNGSPINHFFRSEGRGDNLFLSSIVALDPDSGAYIWHYQEVPGETWDYTASQQITLAELTLNGEPVKVLMHAPKNGFFYVIDRATGKPLSAEKFGPVNWASHIDLTTGRPVETEGARYREDPFLAVSGGAGVHNWQPMSYSPKTGLVYIPIHVLPFLYEKEKPYRFRPNQLNLGYELFKDVLPTNPEGIAQVESILTGSLLAWDPIKQKPAWTIDYPKTYNGGTMATAGDLVFQGTAEGHFNAYDAATGQKLWSVDAGVPILAAPVSYAINEEQFIAVMVGDGGAVPLSMPNFSGPKSYPNGRLLVFSLNGQTELPRDNLSPAPLQKPSVALNTNEIEDGRLLFALNCAGCHGASTLSSGVLPDLKRSIAVTQPELWRAIVIDGIYHERGMVSFADAITSHESEIIRGYVGSEALRIAQEINENNAGYR